MINYEEDNVYSFETWAEEVLDYVEGWNDDYESMLRDLYDKGVNYLTAAKKINQKIQEAIYGE
jgi:hypothetical protein